MRRRSIRRPRGSALLLVVGLAIATTACLEPEPSKLEDDSPVLQTGETREVVLTFTRFNVTNVEQRLTLEDLQGLPRSVLEDIWLFDLDLEPLPKNALEALTALPADEAAQLPVPTQNLRRLITMTPDNADLEGTSLEELIDLSGAVGIPPARALANLLTIGITDPLLTTDVAASVIVDQLVATHPNAQFRSGPIDADHPDGLYPVTPGSVPVTMADVADNFEGLASRFGPTDAHPGVIQEASDIAVATDDFLLTVRVSANALPFRGLDLTNASVTAVNSVPGQIDSLFDFDDPQWMTITGLEPEPTVGRLSLTVVENDMFVPGGTARTPAGQGNSPVWDQPPWEFESIIAEAARRQSEEVMPHCDVYELGTGTTAFEACIRDDRWAELTTFADIGDPPEPSFLWDVILEIAQVRLHDGELAEGEADALLPLEDVPLGIGPEELVSQARDNLAGNSIVLKELARTLTDNTRGDADFFYYRPSSDTAESQRGDWLYFVTDEDLEHDDDGEPTRPYAYATIGFFADAGLTQKISDTTDIDGDTTHEKVRISAGDVLYLADDEGVVFEVVVIDKPSLQRVRLAVTRVTP